ncbi:hypothetical protein QUF31_15205 [Dickeya chrysanthemi]|uniref:hypothetical protein n=1 Tax=Dickeya chrysanthemi TaxID=556 RepID=UPI0025A16E5C|nr:hypothetical protein [Dickeya chrysanthemi]WJM84479.1 hypothetical protein QUF31_15205 [Dickeya chrysanthemi]
MFKVHITQTNPVTGRVTQYTLETPTRTREYAERSAKNLNRKFRKAGVKAEVIEVKHG